MFSASSMWLPDAFHDFQNAPNPFPPHNFTSTNMDPHAGTPIYKPNRRYTKGQYKHVSQFPSDMSETDIDIDTESPYSSRIPDFEYFPRTSLRLPKHTSNSLRPDQILILPSTLTSLKISLHTHTPQRTIRAAVAGDMRLRDVIKQILPQEYLHDTRVYVKSRGEWVEPENPTKVSDIVDMGRFARNDKGEVEIRIVIGGGGREKREYRWERREEGHGWEKGVGFGRMERMRLY
jgi:hypothetical protein